MPQESSGDFYFRRLANVQLLTADREIELSRLVQAGLAPDATQRQVAMRLYAEDRMCRANLRLVANLAKKYRNRAGKLDFDDLIQFGTLGLMRAIRKFDSSLGYRFTTYAYAWIRQSIARGIMDESRTIRLPSHAHEEITKIKELVRQHEISGNRQPLTDEYIAEKLKIPINRYIQLRRVWVDAGTTDSTIFEGLCVENEESTNNISDDERERQKAVVELLIDTFSPRDRDIIEARFGLNGREPETLEAIGERLHLSKERIRQIQNDLTRQLRSYLAG